MLCSFSQKTAKKGRREIFQKGKKIIQKKLQKSYYDNCVKSVKKITNTNKTNTQKNIKDFFRKMSILQKELKKLEKTKKSILKKKYLTIKKYTHKMKQKTQKIPY